MNTLIIKKIEGCSRCGETHLDRPAHQFTIPITYENNIIATHWVTCPNLGEPILVQTNYRKPKWGAAMRAWIERLSEAFKGDSPSSKF